MKTRKFLAFALAAIMALSASISVSAADITADGGSQNVTVSYGTSEGFVVSIPSSITLPEGFYCMEEVAAENVLIAHNKKLVVTVSSENYNDGWYLVDVNETSNKIKYGIQYNYYDTNGEFVESGTLEDGGTILEVASGEAYNVKKFSYLQAGVSQEVTKAGTYQDTLTFTVSVVDGRPISSFSLSEVIFGNQGGSIGSFDFAVGMTWKEFIESDYSNNNFIVAGNDVYFTGGDEVNTQWSVYKEDSINPVVVSDLIEDTYYETGFGDRE